MRSRPDRHTSTSSLDRRSPGIRARGGCRRARQLRPDRPATLTRTTRSFAGDVAAAMNISRAWLQRIEALDAAISREQLERLAHKLQADDSSVATLVRVRD